MSAQINFDSLVSEEFKKHFPNALPGIYLLDKTIGGTIPSKTNPLGDWVEIPITADFVAALDEKRARFERAKDAQRYICVDCNREYLVLSCKLAEAKNYAALVAKENPHSVPKNDLCGECFGARGHLWDEYDCLGLFFLGEHNPSLYWPKGK